MYEQLCNTRQITQEYHLLDLEAEMHDGKTDLQREVQMIREEYGESDILAKFYFANWPLLSLRIFENNPMELCCILSHGQLTKHYYNFVSLVACSSDESVS